MYTTILLYCLYWTSAYYTLHYHTLMYVRVVLLISSNVYVKVCGRECRYCGCVECFQMNTLYSRKYWRRFKFGGLAIFRKSTKLRKLPANILTIN